MRCLPGSQDLVCFQSCLVAVVVPDPETFHKFVHDKLGISGPRDELCQNPVSIFAFVNMLDDVFERYNIVSYLSGCEESHTR